jgi:hypothetical protein
MRLKPVVFIGLLLAKLSRALMRVHLYRQHPSLHNKNAISVKESE